MQASTHPATPVHVDILRLPPSRSSGRTIAAGVLGLAGSLAMFALMHSLIEGEGGGVAKTENLQTIDFVRLKRDSQTETLERRKPPPPPPKAPPPPAKMRVASTAATPQATPEAFAVPNLGLSAGVGGTGPYVGTSGRGGPPAAGTGMFDGDIIPIQRANPVFPREAARMRITGYVQVEVVVSPDGSVREAKVVEAKPKGLFEASAIQAIYKWRFKPKVVDGKPVEQLGRQKIVFDLNAAPE